jgi:hypothetical protein
MDESPADLVRIVRFLSQHSNLDIRLLTISKFVDPSVGTVFVPNVVVSSEATTVSRAGSKRPPVPPEVFMADWESDAGPAAVEAWRTFRDGLDAASIQGCRIGNYPGGAPYFFVDSPLGHIRLMRLADPKVSSAELRDMLHVGPIWDAYPQAGAAREAFRASLLRLVPGAKRAGGANRVYIPVEALRSVTDGVIAALAELTTGIASALRDDGGRTDGSGSLGVSSA